MNRARQIQVCGATDVGCVRDNNEDCFLFQHGDQPPQPINPEGTIAIDDQTPTLVAVSDGMGGAALGEVASQTALETLANHLTESHSCLKTAPVERRIRILERGVHLANQAITEKSRELKISRPMGATVTAGYVENDVLFLFQVGDSRAYVFREGALYRVTRDQSFVGHLVEMGTITEEQAMKHPQRNYILQALGTQENLKVDVSFLPICSGDLIFLCSDGLHGEMSPSHLQQLVADQQSKPLEAIVQALIDGAKASGGKDNVTVVCIKASDDYPERVPGEDPRYQPFPFLAKDNPHAQSESLFR